MNGHGPKMGPHRTAALGRVFGILGAALVVFALSASRANAVNVTYQKGDGKGSVSETDDTTLDFDNPGTHWNDIPTPGTGDDTHMEVDTSPERHAVVKFPNIFGSGPNQIPPGSHIVSATLYLYVDNDGAGGNECPMVYQLTEGWTELEATWTSRRTGVPWSAGGADGPGAHTGVFLGNFPCALPVGFKNLAVTSTVQNWSDGQENEGWVLVNVISTNNGINFRTSEHSVSDRPWLEVDYIPPVFYSVGTDTADLKTGSPTITIASGVATLDLAQTNDIGVGDVIDFDSPSVLVYISNAISPTEFGVQTAAGTLPADVPGPGVGVNTIKRAFNSISQAVTDSSNGSHLGSTDLTAVGRGLTWVVYDDTALNVSATTTITGYVTDASHFITLTVAGAHQVATGNSQRHNGIEGTGARVVATGTCAGAFILDAEVPWTRIRWLEVDANSQDCSGIEVNNDTGEFYLTHLLVHDVLTTTDPAYGIYQNRGVTGIYNNIIYNIEATSGFHHAVGIEFNDFRTKEIYNTTIYNVTAHDDGDPVEGIEASDNAVVFVRNTICMNVTNTGTGGAWCFVSTPANATYEYNMSSDATAAGTPGSLANRSATDQFVSLVGPVNLHLRDGADAIDAGTELSSRFSDDIDGQARPQGGAWEMGADETGFSGASTYYRSIGTAADLLNQGTITVTAGSATVTKTGGSGWLVQNRGRGDVLIVGPDTYTILRVVSDDVLTLASLPTTSYTGGTHTIARQFTTLQAWEDCISFAVSPCPYFPVSSANLVADDRREIGIAYEDSAFTSAGGVPIVLFQSSTTDASHDITLTADGVNRHLGIPGGAGNNVLLDMLAEGGADGVHIQDEFVTVEWLEIINGNGMDGFQVSSISSPSQVTLRYNLIHDTGVGDGMQLRDADLTVDVYNNIIFGVNKAIEFNVAVPTSARILNNTLYDSEEGVFADDSAGGCNACDFDSVLLQNNIAHTFTGPAYYVPSTSSTGFATDASSNNLASDGTGTTHSAAGGGINSVAYASMNFVSATDLHITSGSAAENMGTDLSASFATDIDLEIRPGGAAWDMGADEFGATTAVELLSFEALPADSAVDLSWRTGSELDNLGFHLHRSLSESGPWTRITASLIPGLGSSPEGASYSFRDTGLANGVRYFYRLEDIDAHSGSTFHGPVSAVPGAAPPADDGGSGDSDPDGSDGSGDEDPASEDPADETRTYGRPEEAFFRVVSRTKHAVVVELSTPGFVTTETPFGVRVSVPGFDQRTDPRAPDLPVKRIVLDAVVGRHARIVWVQERKTRSFPGLTPAAVGAAEIVTAPDGTVRPGRRAAALKGEGLLPPFAAWIAGDAFIGETKKLALEVSPLRYDTTTGELLLARRLRVRIAFDRKAAWEETGRGSRGRRRPRSVEDAAPQVLAHLHTQTRGLYAVSFETLFPQGHDALSLDSLRLSRQDLSVPFHVEPKNKSFGPGSVLYFHASHEAASTDYSPEVAYALEQAPGGVPMPSVSASPRGSQALVSASLAEASFETNRYYQAGLLDAPDIWLWDFMVGGMSKSFPLTLEGVDPTSALSAQLQVFLQGASEADIEGEHHLSLSLNGTPIGETTFDGKLPRVFSTSVPASLLVEGENTLAVTNLGDTGAYSFVFLDRVDLVYPRTPALRAGRFSGVFSEAGQAVVSGEARVGLDLTDPEAPVWLSALRPRSGTVSLGVEAGHRYVLASAEGLLSPRVSTPLRSTLRRSTNQAEYILIAPEAFLEAARPLLQRRQDQGLTAKAVSFEEIASEFGHGRPSAQAIRDFLAYAYHSWQAPSLRYVLLLGDSSYDPRNFTGFDQGAPLPVMWVKTSYLWTASDPTLGAVNGEDLLPDVAIGRLPAKTLNEAQALVLKVLAFEDGAQNLSGTAVLVADNPDLAGDFEANVLDIQASFLSGRSTKTLFLRQLRGNTRPEILASFDEGASLMSYVGHGGPAVWASENVLNSWDTKSLLAQSRQPLMLTYNCLNGYFVATNYDSLSEAFLKVEGRGTIGAFAPSGLSLDARAHLFHRALMAEITSGTHERLGDAVLAAQAAYAETGVMPELLAIYHLLADPGMEIQP